MYLITLAGANSCLDITSTYEKYEKQIKNKIFILKNILSNRTGLFSDTLGSHPVFPEYSASNKNCAFSCLCIDDTATLRPKITSSINQKKNNENRR